MSAPHLLDGPRNAVTTCTNMQCEVGGVALTGYVIDDGARWWAWACNEDDARMLVAESLAYRGHDVRQQYEAATGQSIDEAWVSPLTEEVMAGIMFTDEDGTTRPMADEMWAQQERGIIASSEW